MYYINPGEFYDCHSSNYALPEVANLSVLARECVWWPHTRIVAGPGMRAVHRLIWEWEGQEGQLSWVQQGHFPLSQVCLETVFLPRVQLSAGTSSPLLTTQEEVTLSQTCSVISLEHTAMTAHHQILTERVPSLHGSASPEWSRILLNTSNGFPLPRFSAEKQPFWAAFAFSSLKD